MDQKESRDHQETQGNKDHPDQMHLLVKEEELASLVLQDLTVLRAQQVPMARLVLPDHQGPKAVQEQWVPRGCLETQEPQARWEVQAFLDYRVTPVLLGIKVQVDQRDRRVRQDHQDHLDQVDQRDLKVTEEVKEQLEPQVQLEHQGWQVQSVSQALQDQQDLQVAPAHRALKDRLVRRDRLVRLGPLDRQVRQEAKDCLEIEDYLVIEDKVGIVELKDRLVQLEHREVWGHRGRLEPREKQGQLEIKGHRERQALQVGKVPPDLLDHQVLLETLVLLVMQEHREVKVSLDLKVL